MSKTLNDIHWLAPTTIVLSLLVGTAAAIGHHVFYQSLNGSVAGDGNFEILGSSVSQQQLNIAGGTALAFLVKAALTTAVSTAYVQLFWRDLVRPSSKAPTLSTLNSLSAVFSNGFMLGKVWVWWRYPMLFCLAATAWLIPIASIVTPATLSVTNSPVMPRNTERRHIPDIDFVNLNYVAGMSPPTFTGSLGPGDSSVDYYYNGPSRGVVDIVQAVSAGGAILRIDPPRANTTWELVFPGPALQCGSLTSTERERVLWNIANASGLNMDSDSQACNPTGYVAWSGYGSPQNGSTPMPFPAQETHDKNSTTVTYSSSNTTLGSALDFYMAAMPGTMGAVLFGDTFHVPACASYQDPDPTTYFPSATVLHCQMLNASYTVNFDYTGAQQKISVVDLQYNHADRPLARVDSVKGPSSYANSSCSLLNNIGDVCKFDQSLVQTLSYQAILEALSDTIFGKVSNPAGTAAEFQTSVQYTPLINTRELSFLQDPVGDSLFTGSNLQDAVRGRNGTFLQGLAPNRTQEAGVSLIDATEKLFSDIVISMISSKQLQPDLKSPFAPPATTVTFHDFHNVYTYSAAKLWLAYGLAILFALLASIVGLVILLANHASYSADFSSAMLFGRGASLSIQPTQEDLRGRDPLPPRLERARVWLSEVSVVGEGKIPKRVDGDDGEGQTQAQRPLLHVERIEDRPMTRRTL